MDLNHVDDVIVRSYRGLRTRIGVIALAFPLILIAVGYLWSIELQPTLSNYYFAKDPVIGRLDVTPVRLWFCGTLFVVSFFLFRYQGFSKNEDRWLSAAGLFAAGVAIFPMSIDGNNDYAFLLSWIPLPLRSRLSLHGICAVLAFACIAVVIVWFADSSLSEIKDSNPSGYTRYKNIYRAIAIFMVVSIGISIYLNIRYPQGDYVLSAEWCGIWAFAAYWFVKNSEMTEVGRVMKARKRPLRGMTEADLADKL
jgi:hypothetical protein